MLVIERQTIVGLATSWLREEYRIYNTERIHSEGRLSAPSPKSVHPKYPHKCVLKQIAKKTH